MFDAPFAACAIATCSDGEDDASEDLDAALRRLQQFTNKVCGVEGVWHDGGSSPCEVTPSAPTTLSRLGHPQQEPAAGRARTPEVQPGQVVKKPEVIDDFLRNFFIKMGLSRTCEIFEAEWYELKATGRLDSGQTVPDVYLRNAVSWARGGMGRGGF